MKKIIIGNWKLNLDHLEAIQLFQKLNYSLNNDIDKKIDIVVAPSFTSLRSIQTIIEADKLNLFLSSQNVSEFVEGAYTCLLYTSPSPRDLAVSRMPSSA